MRQALSGTILLFIASIGVHPALADFRIATDPQAATVSDTPHIGLGDYPRHLGSKVIRMRRSPMPHDAVQAVLREPAKIGLVEGFGAAVPLSFACRQVVPRFISVTFAPDVDPETPVNWTGGRPWAAVMRDALEPIGLTIVPHGSTIEIRK